VWGPEMGTTDEPVEDAGRPDIDMPSLEMEMSPSSSTPVLLLWAPRAARFHTTAHQHDRPSAPTPNRHSGASATDAHAEALGHLVGAVGGQIQCEGFVLLLLV